MQHLRSLTKDILKRVEEQTGKSVEFMRDESLSVLATLTMARNGASFHVLRYKPTNEPLDYLVAFQAGFALRLFENSPDKRLDFAGSSAASTHVVQMLKSAPSLTADDNETLPKFSEFLTQWALMNLRSLPIGMRIDRWIATSYPELKDLQRASISLQQQQNMHALSLKSGNLAVPSALMGSIAAYALFADRLSGTESYAVPYEAIGVIGQGRELLRLWDETPSGAKHDCELVDSWAAVLGMSDWYSWIPYRP